MKVADTVRSFKEVVEGKHDEIPEQAFYMQGSIDDVLEKLRRDEEAGVTRGRHFRRSKSRRRRNWWCSQQADSPQIPGKDGYMGILPGHAALLSELARRQAVGHARRARRESFTVTGGYVEVRDNHVRVLADGVD